MSLTEQQNFLARLYTDDKLRRDFFAEPDVIGAQNHLTAAEIAEIVSIAPPELNFFAESLFWKRLREAEKFLPLTKKVLNEKFAEEFRKFSQTFNPQTVKKHLEDALNFAAFLQKANVPPECADVARFELAKLRFYAERKRFAWVVMSFDPRPLIVAADEKNAQNQKIKRKNTFAFWLRIGKIERHFIF